jgi:hypothetical protein
MSKKTKKVLQPLSNYLLVKGEVTESSIIIEEKTKKRIERLIIHRAGPDCDFLEAGDEIVVPETLMFINTPKGVAINPDVFIKNKEEDPDDKFVWLVVKDSQVQFKVKS